MAHLDGDAIAHVVRDAVAHVVKNTEARWVGDHVVGDTVAHWVKMWWLMLFNTRWLIWLKIWWLILYWFCRLLVLNFLQSSFIFKKP